MLARVSVVALEALLADHVDRCAAAPSAAGPGPCRCLHARAREALLRPRLARRSRPPLARPGSYQAAVDQRAAARARPADSGSIAARARQIAVDASSSASRSAPSSPSRRRPAAELCDPLADPARAPGAERLARARRSAAGARPRIASIVRGRIAALVSACGMPQHPDQRLADDVVEGEAAPSRARRRRGSSRARARRGRARRGRRRAPGDQLGAAQRRHLARPGWRAACRASRRRGRARSSRWPAARLLGGLVIARVGDHQRRPHHRASASCAARQAVDRGHLGARERRRDRRDRGRRGPRRSPWRRRSPGRRRARPASAPRRRR